MALKSENDSLLAVLKVKYWTAVLKNPYEVLIPLVKTKACVASLLTIDALDEMVVKVI